MTKRLSPTPRWVDRALQGITYWIGHRRALYSGYALGESALVAEMCNMIYAHLSSSQHLLRCEVQYTELVNGPVTTTTLTAKARADIVVSKKINGKREGATPQYVIEVKRASASNKQIDNDLRRLAIVKRQHPSLTTYLIVIAEADRPKRFVDANGSASPHIYRIPDTAQLYRVRRVFKAAQTFKNPERAQYACLIEVSPPQLPERLRRSREWSA